ncbi:MAG: hypothetical protein KC736_04230 [Candidatus Moranbacteria bacterium]|nr:hypothetical protein [Candidatus Moranbacteria bacterium]
MKNNKNLIIILGVGTIAIATIAIACLYMQPTKKPIIPIPQPPVTQTTEEPNDGIVISEPVEEWKTCQNQENGYEIKYPSEWKSYTRMGGAAFETDCKEGPDTFAPNTNINKTSLNVEITITSEGTGFVYEGSKSLDEYFKKRPEMANRYPIIEETSIDNQRAVYVQAEPQLHLLVYHNEKVYRIRGVNISQKTFTDFLSTFKFTD